MTAAPQAEGWTAPGTKETEESLDRLVIEELAQFAEHLGPARWIWRHAPELLTAEKMPQKFIEAYRRKHNGRVPNEAPVMLVDITKPGLRERLFLHAIWGNTLGTDPAYQVVEDLIRMRSALFPPSPVQAVDSLDAELSGGAAS